ncbi:hypothetical protein BALCAV_0200565 [Alkalihalobacillus alcalophilus ATCC 27647 = CGMCC 1.3604]|uniref:Uncharacterized protein n=1 Tax=Alkalihalobacillus alcalophilus ATCC 27647 = CGMCC 1.3604 TaxID=1218173 RepID=A0A094XKB2_ALKAL|nr:hypothetical protein BALCAV_0200565 [Alkalihalobacillus alcalophilus ATCC 27647 = CGMCC 1.3604]
MSLEPFEQKMKNLKNNMMSFHLKIQLIKLWKDKKGGRRRRTISKERKPLLEMGFYLCGNSFVSRDRLYIYPNDE